MSDINQEDPVYVSTKLSISPHIPVSDEAYDYYQEQQKKLPKMKRNQLSIVGLDIDKDQENQIIVTSFIRSTVEKPIHLKTSTIILLDQNSAPFAKVVVDFSNLGTLPPKTSRPWILTFPKESILQDDRNKLAAWSLAFERESKHKLDLSDMGKNTISEFSKAKLEEIAQKTPLEKNELSLLGLSAKRNESDELVTTLLIRNGTMRDLQLKQLPLKFYDAEGDISAKGTFKLAHLMIQANTSKPVTLVFPKSGIIKKQMDLSSWSIQHAD
ncbi:accessory Sec system S-layer assembly protein [Amphibacillus sp. Q70]|uniref:accessory Sec system S-layer assembly protein n=1 Tax=Amphibacillus sp. Q70 TaxID=3453416 RepID=UPI003F876A1D